VQHQGRAGRGAGRTTAALDESRSHSGMECVCVSSRSRRHEQRVAGLMALSASIQCSHDRLAMSIRPAGRLLVFEPLGRPLAAPIVHCAQAASQRRNSGTQRATHSIDTTLTCVRWRWMSRGGERNGERVTTAGFGPG